jgi:hypothetical protein
MWGRLETCGRLAIGSGTSGGVVAAPLLRTTAAPILRFSARIARLRGVGTLACRSETHLAARCTRERGKPRDPREAAQSRSAKSGARFGCGSAALRGRRSQCVVCPAPQAVARQCLKTALTCGSQRSWLSDPISHPRLKMAEPPKSQNRSQPSPIRPASCNLAGTLGPLRIQPVPVGPAGLQPPTLSGNIVKAGLLPRGSRLRDRFLEQFRRLQTRSNGLAPTREVSKRGRARG